MRGLGRDSVASDVNKQFNHFGVITDIHIPRFIREACEFAFLHFKCEEDVAHPLKVNPVIWVGWKRVTIARHRKRGGEVSQEVQSRGKAPLVHSVPNSTEPAYKPRDNSDGFGKSFREAIVGKESVPLRGASRGLEADGLKFSSFDFVDKSTKQRLGRSVVGRWICVGGSLCIQEEAKMVGIDISASNVEFATTSFLLDFLLLGIACCLIAPIGFPSGF